MERRKDAPEFPRIGNSELGAPEFRASRTSAALLVATVVVLILVLIGTASLRRYENYLGGVWVGDADFMARARLQDMRLYIGHPEHGRRPGYLVMVDSSGAFISNQAVEIRERAPAQRWWTALRSAFGRKDVYSANRVDFRYEGGQPMPERLKMSVSAFDGTLALYDATKMFAFLTKDPAASATALAVS